MNTPGTPPPFPIPEAMAGNFEQATRWMQQMWPQFADPAALQKAGTFGGMQPEEVERRIAELRSVERWLELHLSMLRTTIQTMEMQKSAVAAWQAMAASGAASPSGAAAQAAFDPAIWWNALQDQFSRLAATATRPSETPGSAPAPGSSQEGSAAK